MIFKKLRKSSNHRGHGGGSTEKTGVSLCVLSEIRFCSTCPGFTHWRQLFQLKFDLKKIKFKAVTTEVTEEEAQRKTGARLCVLCEIRMCSLWLFLELKTQEIYVEKAAMKRCGTSE